MLLGYGSRLLGSSPSSSSCATLGQRSPSLRVLICRMGMAGAPSSCLGTRRLTHVHSESPGLTTRRINQEGLAVFAPILDFLEVMNPVGEEAGRVQREDEPDTISPS